MALPFLRQPGGGGGWSGGGGGWRLAVGGWRLAVGAGGFRRSGVGPGYVLLGARLGLLREV